MEREKRRLPRETSCRKCLTEEEEYREWQSNTTGLANAKKGERQEERTAKNKGKITLISYTTDSTECSFYEEDENSDPEGILSPCPTDGSECRLYRGEENLTKRRRLVRRGSREDNSDTKEETP